MATNLVNRKTPVDLPDEQRFVLYGVTWHEYESLLKLFDHRRLRITFDQGALELMTLTFEHERFKVLLRRLIETLALLHDIDLLSMGSTTCKKKSLQRGLEPDEGYYLKNAAKMLAKKRLDLKRDPPPDLVVEVDVSARSLNRLEIYAAMKVPEVWRYKNETVIMYHLESGGSYSEVARSSAFPVVSPANIEEHLQIGFVDGESTMVRRFTRWVQGQHDKKTPRKS